MGVGISGMVNDGGGGERKGIMHEGNGMKDS